MKMSAMSCVRSSSWGVLLGGGVGWYLLLYGCVTLCKWNGSQGLVVSQPLILGIVIMDGWNGARCVGEVSGCGCGRRRWAVFTHGRCLVTRCSSRCSRRARARVRRVLARCPGRMWAFRYLARYVCTLLVSNTCNNVGIIQLMAGMGADARPSHVIMLVITTPMLRMLINSNHIASKLVLPQVGMRPKVCRVLSFLVETLMVVAWEDPWWRVAMGL